MFGGRGGGGGGRASATGRGGGHTASNGMEREPLLSYTGENGETREEGAELDKAKEVAVGRLFAEAKPEAGVLVLATIALVAASVSSLVLFKLAGQLVDACIAAAADGDKETARERINKNLFLILGVLAAGGVCNGLRSWLMDSAAERVMRRLRVRLFDSIMRQDIAFFDANRTGELMNRLSEDTRAIKDAATSSISSALQSAVGAGGALTMMLLTSWQLTVGVLLMLPIVIGAFAVFARLQKRYSAAQLTSSAAASTVAEECLSSVRTVRSFANETASCARYGAKADEVLSWGLKGAVARGVFSLTFTFAQAGFMVTLWYGARLVIDGKMTLGSLNAFLLYAIYIGGSIGSLSAVFASVMQALGASRRVFQLLDRVPAMEPGGPEKPMGRPEGASLALVSVWFAYPSRQSNWVLQDFCLDVLPGQKVALVGSSGGGKSTVVALVQRFYDPSRGAVLLDGVDLRSIDHMHLHRQIALVAQEPVLFGETILYNLTFGLLAQQDAGTPVDQRLVEEAAKAAHAHEFVSAFPQGYNTIVGERGVRLSGGQRQRLAIARALLTKPRLLLLDEATSALDAESEYLVQQALDTASLGRTVLVIAHRLSTVQNASSVAVVAEGRVAERGTHKELLASGGIYAQLVHRQLQSASSLSHRRRSAEASRSLGSATNSLTGTGSLTTPIVEEEGLVDRTASNAAQ